MHSISTIGLDIAKSVFQVHGVDGAGQVVLRRQLRRRQVLAFFQKLPPCLVGIEACASSHHWSRELQALGHTVRLMPPAYVKPYVKRQKNDTTDAEAICEAVTRPNMRFVPTKTPEQQSCLTLHRTRHLFIRQQTAVINSIRAYLAEFGIVAPVGRSGARTTAGRRRQYDRSPAPGRGARVSCCSRQSIAGTEGSDTGVRPPHHRLASIERDEQSGWMQSSASVRRWQRRWSPALLIPRLSDRDGISQPGLGSCRSRTRAGVRTGLVVSASKAIAICAACSRPRRARRDPLCPRSTAPGIDLGSPRCWRGDPPRLLPSRSANKLARMALGDDGQERTLQGTRTALRA